MQFYSALLFRWSTKVPEVKQHYYTNICIINKTTGSSSITLDKMQLPACFKDHSFGSTLFVTASNSSKHTSKSGVTRLWGKWLHPTLHASITYTCRFDLSSAFLLLTNTYDIILNCHLSFHFHFPWQEEILVRTLTLTLRYDVYYQREQVLSAALL